MSAKPKPLLILSTILINTAFFLILYLIFSLVIYNITA